MDKKDELLFITQNSPAYFHSQGLSLEKRLNETRISGEKENEIRKEKGIKTVRDKGLSFLGPLGDLAVTVLNWNEEVNQSVTEAKQMLLLEQYFNKADEQDRAIEMLSEFIKNPQGNTLFNKILRIIDDSPPDPELTEHLSRVLKKIVEEGNFEALFEQHRYALGQIERLTPQAITIISDFREWPPIELGGAVSYGSKITSDFYTEFTQAYSNSKGISDINIKKRIQHSVIEIQRLGLMEAYRGPDGKTFCELTEVGKDLLVYIA
ncbi:Uncharacterised protein [Mycobacteroides abscessus subsp. abscessus]|nr:Uncharacterised protein [Mycobacteroides abscessus subsp. abscessus]